MLLCAGMVIAQDSSNLSLWTEVDRKYLLDNLVRTRDSIVKETTNLTSAQWTFKESPERWSIAQVVEHLCYWEIIFSREFALTLRQRPQPGLNKTSRPDSSYFNFLKEETPHVAPAYAQPLGLNDGKNNLALFLKLRNENIEFVKTTSVDLRSCFLSASRPNAHQVYINMFGHCDRHLRQVHKIKIHPTYPIAAKNSLYKTEEIPDTGFWVIVSSRHHKRDAMVQFYNDDKQLIYEEKLPGKIIHLHRLKTWYCLKQGLEKALATFNVSQSRLTGKDWVYRLLKEQQVFHQ